MMDLWNRAVLAAGDALLGWLLARSWTATLAAIAVLTAFLLAALRKVATNQDLLRRASEDKARLKERMGEARRAGDREAAARLKRVHAQVGLRVFGQEMTPVAWALAPIAALATWAYARMGYLAPAAGERVGVAWAGPLSAAGEVVHLAPAEGLSAGSWLAVCERDADGRAVARWDVAGTADATRYPLTVVTPGGRWTGALRTGPGPAEAAEVPLGDGAAVLRVHMREAKLFGLVPGLGAALPPWLVAYLVLVIPLTFISRRLLRVH